MEPFNQAVFLGRVQHIHKGHEKLIDRGLQVAKKIVILVGSAQKGGSDCTEERNPFDADFRMLLIEEIYTAYGDRVIVAPIEDVSGESDFDLLWARKVIQTLDEHADGGFAAVDLMVYGNDENRMAWFDHPEIIQECKHINQLIIAHENNRISATKLRNYILDDNFVNWATCVNPALYKHFPMIRTRMLATKAYEGRG